MQESFIEQEIAIRAPTSDVWKTLVKKQYNQQWISEFSGGKVNTDDWQLHTPVVMTDDSNDAVFEGAIVEFEPNRLLKLEFENGDYVEELTLTPRDQITILSIQAGPVTPSDRPRHSEVWEKGLKKIKNISERLSHK